MNGLMHNIKPTVLIKHVNIPCGSHESQQICDTRQISAPRSSPFHPLPQYRLLLPSRNTRHGGCPEGLGSAFSLVVCLRNQLGPLHTAPRYGISGSGVIKQDMLKMHTLGPTGVRVGSFSRAKNSCVFSILH